MAQKCETCLQLTQQITERQDRLDAGVVVQGGDVERWGSLSSKAAATLSQSIAGLRLQLENHQRQVHVV